MVAHDPRAARAEVELAARLDAADGLTPVPLLERLVAWARREGIENPAAFAVRAVSA